MLDALRFVASAVAKKDFVQELTHFKIQDGRVTGFNGIVALSTDIDVDLDIQPNAAKLISAVKACPGTIALNMTPAGKLAVRSGSFKSFVDCLQEEHAYFVYPEGDSVELGPNFLDAITAVSPVMSVDASRPWAMGVKLRGASAFATNNVMLVEYWHGTDLPFDMVIPAVAVNELIRIGEKPTRVQITDRSISFWFGEKRWMRSALLEGASWPTDRMAQILDASTGAQQEFHPEFFESVAKLKPFLGESGSVYLSADKISTSQHEDEGTSVDVPATGMLEMQAYHHHQLMILGEVAKTIDWTAYPRPCMFQGGALRGALVGQRV
ncbi:DNA polymerase III beta subunit [Aminobacter phage Erebus]|nr:DNA polymerase III beta subunit [Aminobacter phage Erebus]